MEQEKKTTLHIHDSAEKLFFAGGNHANVCFSVPSSIPESEWTSVPATPLNASESVTVDAAKILPTPYRAVKNAIVRFSHIILTVYGSLRTGIRRQVARFCKNCAKHIKRVPPQKPVFLRL